MKPNHVDAFVAAELAKDALQIFLNHYSHVDCSVQPGTEWASTWDCACNDQCPACGVKDIEPYSSEEV